MRTLPFVIIASLLLSSCGSVNLDNPITKARYGDELADLLADLIILKDPIAAKEDMKEQIQAEIAKAKETADEGREEMERGMQGPIIAVKESVTGYVLFLDDRFYVSSDFDSPPGLDLHVYLTTAVDPRDGTFPDDSAVDLGKLKTPYGQQTYNAKLENPETYRTFVLWDKKLKRLYGFAQLAKLAQ
jgi:hypothetical protein